MAVDLTTVLQQMIQDTTNGLKPTDLCFGTVLTPAPVSVQLEGTMQPIPAEAITLTSAVVGRSETVSATDTNGDKVTITVPIVRPLTAGERVIMLRCNHGQNFLILSRVPG